MEDLIIRQLSKRVPALECPNCKGELVYDSEYSSLMCKKKPKNGCCFGLTVWASGSDEKSSFGWSIRTPKKLDFAALGELLKEVARRRRQNRYLANNVVRTYQVDEEAEFEDLSAAGEMTT